MYDVSDPEGTKCRNMTTFLRVCPACMYKSCIIQGSEYKTIKQQVTRYDGMTWWRQGKPVMIADL